MRTRDCSVSDDGKEDMGLQKREECPMQVQIMIYFHFFERQDKWFGTGGRNK
jgi:hypothetical protein